MITVAIVSHFCDAVCHGRGPSWSPFPAARRVASRRVRRLACEQRLAPRHVSRKAVSPRAAPGRASRPARSGHPATYIPTAQPQEGAQANHAHLREDLEKLLWAFSWWAGGNSARRSGD